MNTKKLPKAIQNKRTNASRTKIPAFIPLAIEESDFPKQEAQAIADGLAKAPVKMHANARIHRRFMIKDS